ncbi:hypothetical protein Pyn_38018 [Prunus yedoensis var. nudiflora]|uniref:RecA family profile 2 domain-containing protein n=1 Tax=Prunus yedoensis var. nudiflora TaxID=2094558 RepID=A0A314UZW3_PRUYE|nr:hypothetical protein Pyn_38018 [Prunus yedoensis var. nudiflora]
MSTSRSFECFTSVGFDCWFFIVHRLPCLLLFHCSDLPLIFQAAHFPTPLGSIRKGIESHILAQIGVYYATPQVTSGGIALKFFATVRREIRSTRKIKSFLQDGNSV